MSHFAHVASSKWTKKRDCGPNEGRLSELIALSHSLLHY